MDNDILYYRLNKYKQANGWGVAIPRCMYNASKLYLKKK